jgi:hypothetical protein
LLLTPSPETTPKRVLGYRLPDLGHRAVRVAGARIARNAVKAEEAAETATSMATNLMNRAG